MAVRKQVSVTIADSASLSGEAHCSHERVIGLIYPSGWDAASTTFTVSMDGATFSAAYDGDGNELTIPSRSGAGYVGLTAIQQLTLLGAQRVKIRSGTSGSAVNQSGAVDVVLVLEPL